MTINPQTLNHLRSKRRWSQDDLAAKAGVSKKTIVRLEAGKCAPHRETANRLARALKVTLDDLAVPAVNKDDDENYFKSLGWRTLSGKVDGRTALDFQLVEHIYGISLRSQIIMAPLFAALLAEASLNERRQQLAAVKEATERLTGLAEAHLSFAGEAYGVMEGIEYEKNSIELRDIFAAKISEQTKTYGYDKSKNNPFADFLKDFAVRVGARLVEIDDDRWKTDEGMPEYSVAPSIIWDITGGDFWAEYALLHGHAKIRDIPNELMAPDKNAARAEWLARRIPTDVREEEDAKIRRTEEALGLPSNAGQRE